jgi:hypothetical protein
VRLYQAPAFQNIPAHQLSGFASVHRSIHQRKSSPFCYPILTQQSIKLITTISADQISCINGRPVVAAKSNTDTNTIKPATKPTI